VRIVPKIPNVAYAIRQLATVYDTPIEALREYPSNAIDNFLQAGLGSMNIRFIFHRKWKTPKSGLTEPILVVTDDGTGMNWSRFSTIPENVAYSDKRGDPKTIGEKGLGVWAYASISDFTEMTMFTRYPNDNTLNRSVLSPGTTRMHQQLASGLNANLRTRLPKSPDIYYACSYPTMRNLEKNIFPDADPIFFEDVDPAIPFNHGTMVVVRNIPEKIMLSLERRIPVDLTEMYDPIIREGKVVFTVIYQGGRNEGKRTLGPFQYSGDLLVDLSKKVEYVDEQGDTRVGNVQAHILRAKRDARPKVRLYNKGVYVADLQKTSDDFNQEPWLADRIIGYLSADFLNVKPGRSQLVVDERFGNFIEAMRNVGKEVADGLRKIHPVERPIDPMRVWTDKFLQGLFDVLPGWEREFVVQPRSPVLVPGTSEDPKISVTPSGGRGIENNGDKSEGRERPPRPNGRKDPNNTAVVQPPAKDHEGETTDRKGREALRPSSDGNERNVKRGRAILPYTVERSTEGLPLGVDPRLGSYLDYSPAENRPPRIIINLRHPDRIAAEKRGIDDLRLYDAMEIAGQVAIAEIQTFCYKQKIEPRNQPSSFAQMTPKLVRRIVTEGFRKTGVRIET